jgi:ZIP family zinc transporter
MLATGVLIFLFYDVISKASEPINNLIVNIHTHHTSSNGLVLDVILLLGGLTLGFMGLVYFNTYVISHLRFGQKRSESATNIPATSSAPQIILVGTSTNKREASQLQSPEVVTISTPPPPSKELSPHMLALVIAIGIGFHNFSEGMAIGQSAATGALQLATVLIIGFGLHNMTEGFGIAGPLIDQRISLRFIVLIGLIGGGPTFLGTMVGIMFHSTEIFIFCLAFAAGAIIYVVMELFGAAKRFKHQDIVMWGLLLGFLLGYATDLLVTYAGA